MKTATFKITEITDRLNGYGMPIIKVQSDLNLTVINRGYNEFECLQDIDESDLLQLRSKIDLSKHDKVMLEVKTPSKNTNCWYSLKGQYIGKPNTNCIIW